MLSSEREKRSLGLNCLRNQQVLGRPEAMEEAAMAPVEADEAGDVELQLEAQREECEHEAQHRREEREWQLLREDQELVAQLQREE